MPDECCRDRAVCAEPGTRPLPMPGLLTHWRRLPTHPKRTPPRPHPAWLLPHHWLLPPGSRVYLPRLMASTNPSFPIWIPFDQCALGRRGDQAIQRPCSACDGRRQGRKARQRLSGAARDSILASAGRTSPAASRALCGSAMTVDHAGTVTAGGPRSPLMRPNVPAKTIRRRAASAIWNTA